MYKVRGSKWRDVPERAAMHLFRSEFKMTCPLSAPSLKRKRDDRPAFEAASDAIARYAIIRLRFIYLTYLSYRLHAPGGSLDSQVSDTQWLVNTCGSKTPKTPKRSPLVTILSNRPLEGLGTSSQPYFVHSSQSQDEHMGGLSQEDDGMCSSSHVMAV
jgi:hypothetical protein